MNSNEEGGSLFFSKLVNLGRKLNVQSVEKVDPSQNQYLPNNLKMAISLKIFILDFMDHWTMVVKPKSIWRPRFFHFSAGYENQNVI